MNQTDWWTLAAIAGMAVMTVVARSFFFLSSKPWTLPDWARRGLVYAPVAAMAAVIAPEIVMTAQGQVVGTWQDARLFGAAAAAAWYWWRRGMFGVIVAGLAVYLPLHLGMNW